MTKEFEAIFRLFDVTNSEKHGDLLEQSEIFRFEGLSEIQTPWDAWREQAPVELGLVKERAMRVSMTRNGGVGVQRIRFEFEGSKYLVTVHCAEQHYQWSAQTPGGESFTITLEDGEPAFFIEGDGRAEMDRRPLSRLAVFDE